MSAFTRFFDRLSRNDRVRMGRLDQNAAEAARIRKIYRDIYYI